MPEEINQLIAKAPFSFVGTILQLGAGTMTDIAIDERTAVVRVEHVLHAPDAFTRIEGHHITLQSAPNLEPLAVGQTLAFFAEGHAFGESIAVTEISRLPVDAVKPYMTRVLAGGAGVEASSSLLDDVRQKELREHMQSADAVVVGRVVSIVKAGPVTYSEHDPDWWRATIDVYHIERGKVGTGKIKVLFANSSDVQWHLAPKAAPSQQGIWVLHRARGNLRRFAPFQILHPEDYQPTQRLEVLR